MFRYMFPYVPDSSPSVAPCIAPGEPGWYGGGISRSSSSATSDSVIMDRVKRSTAEFCIDATYRSAGGDAGRSCSDTGTAALGMGPAAFAPAKSSPNVCGAIGSETSRWCSSRGSRGDEGEATETDALGMATWIIEYEGSEEGFVVEICVL